MNLIFDLGGVLMMHNIPGCVQKFTALMGEENMKQVLGLCPNGEGQPNSLMEQYELGLISEKDFMHTIQAHCRVGTSIEDIQDAWNTMHAGIPEDYWKTVQQIHNGQISFGAEVHLFVLSNNNETHYQDILNHYDMSMFEQVFLSNRIHAIKPQRPIYEAVMTYLTEHGLEKDETIFVDDIAENRAMGEEFGWQTAENLHFLVEKFGHVIKKE